jgi:hypothetical protein
VFRRGLVDHDHVQAGVQVPVDGFPEVVTQVGVAEPGAGAGQYREREDQRGNIDAQLVPTRSSLT